MNEEDVRVPVYLVTGFLDSGKTSFLNETIREDYFAIRGLTLLIACEHGDTEFDAAELRKRHTVLVYLEEPEELTLSRLKEFDRKYRPERVLLEFNPLWRVATLEAMPLPDGWGIVQHIVVVDASTFTVYMNNMKSLFVEMMKNADMVSFNRCTTEMPLANFRRSIKVVNRKCQVFFEDENGEMLDMSNNFDMFVPYDTSADVIEIGDDDFGIFYVDAGENAGTYDHKTVRFRGVVLKSRKKHAKFFVPSRKAMTCCAADIQYIGYMCRYQQADDLKVGQWVDVTAEVRYEDEPMYGEVGPVLYAKRVEKTDPPEEELVYFT